MNTRPRINDKPTNQPKTMLPMAEFALMLVEKTLKEVKELQRELNRWSR